MVVIYLSEQKVLVCNEIVVYSDTYLLVVHQLFPIIRQPPGRYPHPHVEVVTSE